MPIVEIHTTVGSEGKMKYLKFFIFSDFFSFGTLETNISCKTCSVWKRIKVLT